MCGSGGGHTAGLAISSAHFLICVDDGDVKQ